MEIIPSSASLSNSSSSGNSKIENEIKKKLKDKRKTLMKANINYEFPLMKKVMNEEHNIKNSNRKLKGVLIRMSTIVTKSRKTSIFDNPLNKSSNKDLKNSNKKRNSDYNQKLSCANLPVMRLNTLISK